jgi:hypothetical protein
MTQRSVTTIDIWAYREPAWSAIDVTGFGVEARDGHIGTVDEASLDPTGSFLVLKTGMIFGKKVMLPAGVITGVDEEDRKVYLSLTKDEIKSAPEFEEERYHEPSYREQLGDYYRNRPPGPDYGKDDRGRSM